MPYLSYVPLCTHGAHTTNKNRITFSTYSLIHNIRAVYVPAHGYDN